MNPWKRSAQETKARRILDVLDQASPGRRITTQAVEKLLDYKFAEAAVIAGARPPSAETIALVKQMVRERLSCSRLVREAVEAWDALTPQEQASFADELERMKRRSA